MKKAIMMMGLMMTLMVGKSQSIYLQTSPSNTDLKAEYKYIVVYRTWEQASNAIWNGLNANKTEGKWQYHCVGFQDVKQIKDWINKGKNYYSEGEDVRLDEDEMIGIYDITGAKKLSYKLHTREHTVKDSIIIKERKWSDNWYEIK